MSGVGYDVRAAGTDHGSLLAQVLVVLVGEEEGCRGRSVRQGWV